MKAATVHEIKQELQEQSPAKLTEICLRLARFKKENKELLTYLLFEAHHEAGYVSGIKEEINLEISSVNASHLYYAKKSLQKIVRLINKYSRYSGNAETELQLRLYFCQSLLSSGIPFTQNTVINNLYQSQVKKVRTLLASLHEDLQYDYKKDIALL